VKLPTQVWIFYNSGQLPYEVKVMHGNAVTVFPCSNTKVETIKRQMRDLFGRCVFTYVEILPDNGKVQ